MDGAYSQRHGPPPSIKEITDKADDFVFNVNIPFKYWVQSCKTLAQEASYAMRDGDYARAYLMLYRQSTLIASKLRTHPQFRAHDSKNLYRSLQDDLPHIIAELEGLKPLIQEQYDEWRRMQPPESKRTEPSKRGKPSTYDEHAARDISLRRPNTRIIDATDNLDFAVDMAQSELRKRDAAKRSSRSSHADDRYQQSYGWDSGRARQPRLVRDDERSTSDARRPNFDRAGPDDDLRAQMEAARRRLDSAASLRPDIRGSNRSGKPNSGSRDAFGQSFHYPTTSPSQPVEYVPQRLTSHLPTSPRPQRPPKEPTYEPNGLSEYRAETPREESQYAAPPPARPAKTPMSNGSQELPSQCDAPPRPGKESLDWETRQETWAMDGHAATDMNPAPSRPPKDLPATAESETRKSPDTKIAFRPASYLENGDPMRFVFLPSKLRSRFLEIASPNTQRGLETCGVLCGSVVNGGLFITCLLIPEQNSTPDTCETTNESAILDHCINEDLLIIGWIHTHPTQTCFMSSRDLHTQAGYQVMMPESIAIVCAPRHEPSYGVFRLTNPPGLPHILQCTATETFHQHSIDNIYTGSMAPAGHVTEVAKLAFTVKDLRP